MDQSEPQSRATHSQKMGVIDILDKSPGNSDVSSLKVLCYNMNTVYYKISII